MEFVSITTNDFSDPHLLIQPEHTSHEIAWIFAACSQMLITTKRKYTVQLYEEIFLSFKLYALGTGCFFCLSHELFQAIRSTPNPFHEAISAVKSTENHEVLRIKNKQGLTIEYSAPFSKLD